jgi:hypothetical protein
MTAVSRRRISRLKTAALKYAAALDDGADIKKTAALYKRLLKILDPEDIVMLVNAWIEADNAAQKPKRRASLRWMKNHQPTD